MVGVVGGRGQAHCDSGANGSPAQASGGEANLLEYPVTTVGSLGLWSFIAGGTQSGAERGRNMRHTRTETPTSHGMVGREAGRTGKEKGGHEGMEVTDTRTFRDQKKRISTTSPVAERRFASVASNKKHTNTHYLPRTVQSTVCYCTPTGPDKIGSLFFCANVLPATTAQFHRLRQASQQPIG